MVDHAWIRENVGVADVIQILGFPVANGNTLGQHPRMGATTMFGGAHAQRARAARGRSSLPKFERLHVRQGGGK